MLESCVRQYKIRFVEILAAKKEDGGCGATRITVDFCKFGTKYRKRTDFWTNIPSLIVACGGGYGPNDPPSKHGPDHTHLCEGEHKCGYAHEEGHARITVHDGKGVPTSVATPYPEGLITWLILTHIQPALEHRRTDGVPEFSRCCQSWDGKPPNCCCTACDES